MSRHRLVRNMNIQGNINLHLGPIPSNYTLYFSDELDDDAMSDGGEADLSPEDYSAL